MSLRLAGMLAAGVAALVLLALLGAFLNDPLGIKRRAAERDRVAAVQGRADAASGRAQGDLVAAGAAIVDRGRDRDARTVVIREGNRDALRTSPGADAPLDPRLVARWRVGLCNYAAYHGDPACAAVRADDTGQLQAARPGRSASTP